jgi:hypothetical protein
LDLLKVENLIKDQFPEFYREEFPQLIKFVEKYYEFLGTTNYSALSSVTDIDNSLDEFLVHLKDNFAKNVPEFGKLSDRDFLHVSKQFYSSRGSNESYKFLFRAMFGKEVELAYPGEFVLKPSDGYWEQEVSFRVFSNDDLTQAVGQFIDVISPDIFQQGQSQQSSIEDISLEYYDVDSILGNSNVIVNAWTPDAWDHDFTNTVGFDANNLFVVESEQIYTNGVLYSETGGGSSSGGSNGASEGEDLPVGVIKEGWVSYATFKDYYANPNDDRGILNPDTGHTIEGFELNPNRFYAGAPEGYKRYTIANSSLKLSTYSIDDNGNRVETSFALFKIKSIRFNGVEYNLQYNGSFEVIYFEIPNSTTLPNHNKTEFFLQRLFV